MHENSNKQPFKYFKNNLVKIIDPVLSETEYYKTKALVLKPKENSHKIYLVECLANSKKLFIRIY